MPTNLNALIRYKTIDRCLKNENIKWTIERLQEECTEALGEARGVYKKVSKRTIYDDIRVMRSDILEFNAPIVFENGGYRYSIPLFSIFRAEISEMKLLQKVFEILVKNKDTIKHRNLYDVVEELAALTNNKIPDDIHRPVFKGTSMFLPSFEPSEPIIQERPVLKENVIQIQEQEPIQESVKIAIDEFMEKYNKQKELYDAIKPNRKFLYYWYSILDMLPPIIIR
jgi:hypothetical protein